MCKPGFRSSLIMKYVTRDAMDEKFIVPIGGYDDPAKGGPIGGRIEMTKKEWRKRKKLEKENMWQRSGRRKGEGPVVVRLPKHYSTVSRSALQTVHKESAKARDHHFYQGGLNHDWVGFYERNISSEQSCVNEWNAMANLESRRPPSPDSLTNKEETELLIRSKLKEIMMSVDIDEVTSKCIRQRLEEDLQTDLFKYKSFIDEEMLIILGQMDAATEIFPHVYLGSEWNASNLDELRDNRVGFILNVTKEIDNFFPGMFDYLNIRVYDDEKTELLRHWDDTYRYISLVRDKGSRVLVHCKMGISRSASVVIAYAMKAYNLSLDEATELVKNKRSCIKPNQAFSSQLKIYQGILDASRQRHNALFRSKSENNLKFLDHKTSQQRLLRHPISMVEDTAIHSSQSEDNYQNSLRFSNSQSNEEPMLFCRSDSYHLSVPYILQPQRPKSWSPDDDTARFLAFRSYIDFGENGELMQKCQSLNDQFWHAHVTVQQRSAQITGFPELGAINPIYAAKRVPSSPSLMAPSTTDPRLSSSVKKRIDEFESARVSRPTSSSNGPTLDFGSTDDVTASADLDHSMESLYSSPTTSHFPLVAPPLSDQFGSSPDFPVNVLNEKSPSCGNERKEETERQGETSVGPSTRDEYGGTSSDLEEKRIQESASSESSASNDAETFKGAWDLTSGTPQGPNWDLMSGTHQGPNGLSMKAKVSADSSCQVLTEQPIQSWSVAKAYVPTPFRSACDKDTYLSDRGIDISFNAASCNHSVADVPKVNEIGPKLPFGNGSPSPGKVKLTRRKLENKMDDSKGESVSSYIGRSLSSGCMCSQTCLESRINPLTRSASEKRAKTVCESSCKAILLREVSNKETSKSPSIKGVTQRIKDIFGRSMSLERLEDFSSNSDLQTSGRSESQSFLDQLVVETEAQLEQLEGDQEEIRVRNLVDMFEEGKRSHRVVCSHKRKIRPRSESFGDKDSPPPLPPVPQRKSSLDLNFRPSNRPSGGGSIELGCHPTPAPIVRGKTGSSFCKQTNGSKLLPPPPTGRTCGTEVRRKKQQGKTHPLSKLVQRENPL